MQANNPPIQTPHEPAVVTSPLLSHREDEGHVDTSDSIEVGEPTKDQDRRPSFCLLLQETTYQSPIAVILRQYNTASYVIQRQACLRYLLHYQHYNAEFTDEENKQLGYPAPLCAKQNKSGYLRTDHERVLQLLVPWIKKNLVSFFKNSFIEKQGAFQFHSFVHQKPCAVPEKFISSVNNSIIAVLKRMYGGTHQIDDAQSFHFESTRSRVIRVIVVKLDLVDLRQTAIDIIQKNLPRGMEIKSFDILFLLQAPNIDCILTWGARLEEKSQLRVLALKDIFSRKVYSLLHKCGAVPDRLAVNEFITYDLGRTVSFVSDVKVLGIDDTTPILPVQPQAGNWLSHVKAMSEFAFELKDEGVQIYRDAIVRWQQVLSIKPGLHTLDSLLCSQVVPWCSRDSSIIQWAKAYQNLCEIVLLYFECFLQIASKINMESIALKVLDPHEQLHGIKKTIGVYPYGMGAFFAILEHVLNCRQGPGKPSLACCTQNYFETFALMQEMGICNYVHFQKKESLLELESIPDILVTDIHPNNARMDQLHQNNVGQWIQSKLQTDHSKKIILILDITMNHLSDPIIQKTLSMLKGFILSNPPQLEVFLVQSLAKLIQLGADNFSGGACIHLAKSETANVPKFFKGLPQKTAFFGIFIEKFQDISEKYFSLVRKNADWMNRKLNLSFSEIQGDVSAKLHGQTRSFCATNVAVNVDEGTVYVAIRFDGFFDYYPYINRKSDSVEAFQELLWKLSKTRGLPLTQRQSFGFSLSSLCGAAEAIRFYIGVENKQILEQYVNVFRDFSYALSTWVTKKGTYFFESAFASSLTKVYKILGSGHYPSASPPIPLVEEEPDSYDTVGKAVITFSRGILGLKTTDDQLTAEPNIGIHRGGISVFLRDYWPFSQLFKLFLELELTDKATFAETCRLYVQWNKSRNAIEIGGFLEARSLFQDCGGVIDERSKIEVIFAPKFILICPTQPVKEYKDDKIFVRPDDLDHRTALGTDPIKLNRLRTKDRNQIFVKCVRYYITLLAYPDQMGCVLMNFFERKPYENYRKKIENLLIRNDRLHLHAVVNYINELSKLPQLPLSEDHDWHEFASTPFQVLCSSLDWVGSVLSVNLRANHIRELEKINNRHYLEAIVKGLFEALHQTICEWLENDLQSPLLSSRTAMAIAEFFSNKVFQKYIHWERLDLCLCNIEKFTQIHPSQLQKLGPYLQALFPLIKNRYSTGLSLSDAENSSSLYNIAQAVKDQSLFPALWVYVNILENALFAALSYINVNKIICYLRFYLRYPLCASKKKELLNLIREGYTIIPLTAWVEAPEFCDPSLDSVRIFVEDLMPPEDFIIKDTEREAVKEFFQETGARDLLKDIFLIRPETFLEPMLRWATICQDQPLFQELLTALDVPELQLSFDLRCKLRSYSCFLNIEDDVQNKLKDVLNNLMSNISSEISSKELESPPPSPTQAGFSSTLFLLGMGTEEKMAPRTSDDKKVLP